MHLRKRCEALADQYSSLSVEGSRGWQGHSGRGKEIDL